MGGAGEPRNTGRAQAEEDRQGARGGKRARVREVRRGDEEAGGGRLEVKTSLVFFFFQAEDGIRDGTVTGVQTCALPIFSPAQKSSLANMVSLASMATSASRWNLSSGTGAGVDPWYQSGAGTVYPDRWAAAMQAWQRNYNRTFWMVQAFNEPDYGWGQGSQQNFYDILGYLQAATNFNGSLLGGGCTLSDDVALSWFNAISPRVNVGTTHCLAGSANNYITFLQRVTASN